MEVTIMSKGLFGGLFDFDHDGKINAFERAAEFQFFNDVVMAAEDEDAFHISFLLKVQRMSNSTEIRESISFATEQLTSIEE